VAHWGGLSFAPKIAKACPDGQRKYGARQQDNGTTAYSPTHIFPKERGMKFRHS